MIVEVIAEEKMLWPNHTGFWINHSLYSRDAVLYNTGKNFFRLNVYSYAGFESNKLY